MATPTRLSENNWYHVHFYLIDSKAKKRTSCIMLGKFCGEQSNSMYIFRETYIDIIGGGSFPQDRVCVSKKDIISVMNADLKEEMSAR